MAGKVQNWSHRGTITKNQTKTKQTCLAKNLCTSIREKKRGGGNKTQPFSKLELLKDF